MDMFLSCRGWVFPLPLDLLCKGATRNEVCNLFAWMGFRVLAAYLLIFNPFNFLIFPWSRLIDLGSHNFSEG